MTKVVLVVGDEPHIRNFVRHVAEGSGYAVKEAANADDALRLLEENDFAAVLMTTLEMPGGFNGI